MSEVIALKSPRSGTRLRIGFLRLTDSATAIVAQEFGYFAEEGIDAELIEEPSWANIADKLAYGFLDAAVIIPPLGFAIELGLRGISQKLIIPCNISLGGNTITLARDLALQVREMAAKKAISTPHALAACLKGRSQPLSLGIVHSYSTHNLLLRYWLATAGLEAGRDVRLSVVRRRAPSKLCSRDRSAASAPARPGRNRGPGRRRDQCGIVRRCLARRARKSLCGAPELGGRKSRRTQRRGARPGTRRAILRTRRKTPPIPVPCCRGKNIWASTATPSFPPLPGGAIRARQPIALLARPPRTFPCAVMPYGFWSRCALGPDRQYRAQGLAAWRVYRSDLYRAAVAPLGISVPWRIPKPKAPIPALAVGRRAQAYRHGPDASATGRFLSSGPG
jgi:NitT/TauT family transport system ATP-binding protein/nitrate/nitrite transport system substrate-binding protein